MRLVRLARKFYLRPTLDVARDLLGLCVVRRIGRTRLVGRIVEVEAYMGERDPASHSYRGRSVRNDVMFREGGHLYVYFTYGMHYCCNVVTEGEGIPHADLLRALHPLRGLAAMAANRQIALSDLSARHTPPSPAMRSLTNGPGKLCQALRIGREENGTDLCGNIIWIAADLDWHARPGVATSTRVGISSATEHPWRFYFEDDPFVSPGRPVGTPPQA